ncbi:MAG: Re/Si-specific NAD(P)(+) transhydrogenase subunit alpha [Candidatus Thermoplasmatota archaeon]|nr:Re/Si-specific NAD(P)(+) transhydrogenase subunit alpha [Candidatus Thermoplasmatota archaeon]
MIVGVVKETVEGERRVALDPDSVARLRKRAVEVRVQSGAGEGAFHGDASYEAAGATVVADASSVWQQSDVILKVNPPTSGEVGLLRAKSIIIGFLNPLRDPALIQRIADREASAFSMEMIPRISRAQSMDALSSQSSVAGYKAALLAASTLTKFFPMMTTAAGTVRPARVFVIGAGVAGLQAIATARRLGAEVEAFDIRPVVKEEVQSLGARFVEVDLEEETEAEGGYAKEVSEAARKREQDLLAEHVASSDVVITTAQVPGKKAPVLVTETMLAAMKPGSVVIDLAADQGGNVELSRPDEQVSYNGVTILGPANLPSSLPVHATQMYAKNLMTLLDVILQDGELRLDLEDEIVDASLVVHAGEVRNERVREAIAAERAA